MKKPVVEMRNLGPYMARALREIGVETEAELRALGAVEAFARMQFVGVPRLSLNALYAMDAALADADWRMIPPERKDELRRQLSGRLQPAAEKATRLRRRSSAAARGGPGCSAWRL